MAKFVYNNAKNVCIGSTFFKLNYKYLFYISYKENIKLQSKFKAVNKLLTKLEKLILVFGKNLLYIQKLQKQVYDKGIKAKSYVFVNKVQLNSKFIKIKQNQKLEAKFFKPF